MDVLHTDDKKTGGKIRFTLQHIGELIHGPTGAYRVDLEIIGSHLGCEFKIPFSLTFSFSGGMNLVNMRPVKKNVDTRIKEIDVSKDGVFLENWKGSR